MPDPQDIATLLDWKRRIFSLYGDIRASDPEVGWELWVVTRNEMFSTHPQSPIPEAQRTTFAGLDMFAYDSQYRVMGEVSPEPQERFEIGTSGDGTYAFTRFGSVAFELLGAGHRLDLFWLEGYGGGLFLPFRDVTSGSETYGAGRYLLDTVKGADLGEESGHLVLDFNFAYNPSCSYDPRWVCPLAPPNNRLTVEVRAGERTPATSEGAA